MYDTDEQDELNGAELNELDGLYSGGSVEGDELDSFEDLRAFSEPDDDRPEDDRWVNWERDDWEDN